MPTSETITVVAINKLQRYMTNACRYGFLIKPLANHQKTTNVKMEPVIYDVVRNEISVVAISKRLNTRTKIATLKAGKMIDKGINTNILLYCNIPLSPNAPLRGANMVAIIGTK